MHTLFNTGARPIIRGEQKINQERRYHLLHGFGVDVRVK
jgi:hypothetical protein